LPNYMIQNLYFQNFICALEPSCDSEL
jgi:hypothetical protein